MITEKCIYCLKDKPLECFNIEHVVPQMFGKYENNYTLADSQVCKGCNKYFSDTFESPISLDSFEAFLRISEGNKRISDGRKISGNRVKFTGNSGSLEGLRFHVITDKSQPTGFRADIVPCIGMKISDTEDKYLYFEPEEIPLKNEHIMSLLKSRKSPIVFFGLEKEYVNSIFQGKGYELPEPTISDDITEFYSEPDIIMQISLTVDNILLRLSSKVVFNYMTYKLGKQYSLLPMFNEIRLFIREGIITDKMPFTMSDGGVAPFSKYKGSHAVGLSWGDGTFKSLYGMVSWFGKFSYRIPLTRKSSGFSRKLPASVFMNDDLRKIIDFNGNFQN